MKFIKLFFVVVLFVGCKKIDFNIQNLNGNQISIFGHGGMGWGQGYPLNTFESLQKCLNYDVHGTEIDVQMTKDSVLVAFHDRDLSDDTFASGSIYEKNWDEIKDLSLSNSAYPQYGIHSLHDLFSNLNNIENYTFILDCKNFSPDVSDVYVNQYTNAFIEIIDHYDLQQNVILELKKETLIDAFLTKRPALNVFYNGSFEDALPIALEYSLEGITQDLNVVEESQIQLAHENGIKVAVYNALNRNRNIQAINYNVDYIITDRVEFLVNTLN